MKFDFEKHYKKIICLLLTIICIILFSLGVMIGKTYEEIKYANNVGYSYSYGESNNFLGINKNEYFGFGLPEKYFHLPLYQSPAVENMPYYGNGYTGVYSLDF